MEHRERAVRARNRHPPRLFTQLVAGREADPYGSTASGDLLDALLPTGTPTGPRAGATSTSSSPARRSTATRSAWRLSAWCAEADAYGIVQSDFNDNLIARPIFLPTKAGHNWAAGHCTARGTDQPSAR